MRILVNNKIKRLFFLCIDIFHLVYSSFCYLRQSQSSLRSLLCTALFSGYGNRCFCVHVFSIFVTRTRLWKMQFHRLKIIFLETVTLGLSVMMRENYIVCFMK